MCLSQNLDYCRVQSTLVIDFTIISDYSNIQDTTEPAVQDTTGLSDLPEGVLEYNVCPYLSNRDIIKMTYLKNYYLKDIASRVLSKRDEKSKFLSRLQTGMIIGANIKVFPKEDISDV